MIRDDLAGLRGCLNVCHYPQNWDLKSWFGIAIWIPNLFACLSLSSKCGIWNRGSGLPFGSPTLLACLWFPSTVKCEIVIRDDVSNLRACPQICHYRQTWNLTSWFGMTFLVSGEICRSVIIAKFEIWNRDSGWRFWSLGMSACLSLSSIWNLKSWIGITIWIPNVICMYAVTWNLKFETVIRGDHSGLRRCLHVVHYRHIWHFKSWFGMTFRVIGNVCLPVNTVKFANRSRDVGWFVWCSDMFACLSSS